MVIINSFMIQYTLKKELENQSDLFGIDLDLRCRGNTIPIAYMKDDILYGIEIRSDNETLYGISFLVKKIMKRMFDRIIIVSTEMHRNSLLRILPSYCGLYVVNEPGGYVEDITFRVDRPPKTNYNVEIAYLVRFLRKRDCLRLIRDYGYLDRYIDKEYLKFLKKQDTMYLRKVVTKMSWHQVKAETLSVFKTPIFRKNLSIIEDANNNDGSK